MNIQIRKKKKTISHVPVTADYFQGIKVDAYMWGHDPNHKYSGFPRASKANFIAVQQTRDKLFPPAHGTAAELMAKLEIFTTDWVQNSKFLQSSCHICT